MGWKSSDAEIIRLRSDILPHSHKTERATNHQRPSVQPQGSQADFDLLPNVIADPLIHPMGDEHDLLEASKARDSVSDSNPADLLGLFHGVSADTMLIAKDDAKVDAAQAFGRDDSQEGQTKPPLLLAYLPPALDQFDGQCHRCK